MTRSARAGRPNVIVVFTDQQRWDTLGCYGSGMDLTDNLDAMARRGVRFERAFTCQPVCSPARASLQTGKYATATGVWKNGLQLPADERTLAHEFKAAGYRVGYVGKWHLAGTRERPVPAGLRGGYTDCWQAADVMEFTSHPSEGHWFDEDDRAVEFAGYRVDALTDKALQFVRGGEGEPFFLFLSYVEPHHQNDMNRFVAPDGYAERYANCHVPADLRGLPGDWMSQLPDYYGICKRIDENVGRILAHVEGHGLADNTIVAYLSDHGCHFRTRNSEYKRSCHDGSIRIPLIFQGPGFNRRAVIPEPVSLVDVSATLLDAAGIEVPGRMHGRSMMPLLDRRNPDWPAEVFLQISESETGRAIRTERWKYSVFAPGRSGWEDADSGSDHYVERYLYDLCADPAERVNLVGRPEYAQVAERLRERLVERMVAAGEQAPTIEPARFYA